MSIQLSEGITNEEIALEGARLIDEFFSSSPENCLEWSPCSAKDDTALVYGSLFDADEQKKRFKALLRQFFHLAGFRELSYVEYFDGGCDPIWVMLVAVHSGADLSVGVDLCRWASCGWPLQQYLRLQRYPKKRLNCTLKLLVSGYPELDLNQPLDQLILP